MTNYDRITASPEKLAEFLSDVTNACSSEPECLGCPLDGHCAYDDGAMYLEWLQEECD